MGRSILTALKRENEKDKAGSGDGEKERETDGGRERERGHRVDKGQRNNGLMVIEDGQNNHCSALTRLNIGLM